VTLKGCVLREKEKAMKATDQLKAEHEGIKMMLSILDKICLKLESGEQADVNHLEQILEFFRIFVDRCHHGKEEDLLFPAMEQAGVPREGGPIGQMLVEHDHGRSYVKGMADAVADYKAGNLEAAKKIATNARGYIATLQAHIQKENMVLFSIADSRLSNETQERLYEEFEQLEENKIGLGKHEEFHGLLNHLADMYLK
jgi:hemerythrin-like domain-containing protein